MKDTRRNKKANAAAGCGALLVQSLTGEQLARLLDVVFAGPDTIVRQGQWLRQVA